MAQLFDTTASALRVANDVVRFSEGEDKGESYCKTLPQIKPVVNNLLFKRYSIHERQEPEATQYQEKGFTDLKAIPNKKRRPSPKIDSKGKTTYFTFKAASKTWKKKSNGKYDWHYSETTDIEKKAFVQQSCTALNVSAFYLVGNTLHLYFYATRGLPYLYGNGDMRNGQYQYKLTQDGEIFTCYRDAAGIKDGTYLLGWEEREYVVTKKNNKNVWGSVIGRTNKPNSILWRNKQPAPYEGNKTEKVDIFYKTEKNKDGTVKKDKNGKIVYKKDEDGKKIVSHYRGYKYVHKYYWAPLILKDNDTFYCKSFNKIHKIVSYPGFKGNLTNELLGEISFIDWERRIKAIRPQGFSNEGADDSGVATCFISDVTYKCKACGKYNTQDHRYLKTHPGEFKLPSGVTASSELGKSLRAEYDEKVKRFNDSCHCANPPQAQKISFKLYLSALDNRKLPTLNINGHINAPVLLNVDKYY